MICMNIIFDLGGVVVRWDPALLLSRLLDDDTVRHVVAAEFLRPPDWLALDRGTMAPALAVALAAERTGLPAGVIAKVLDAVPSSLVPFDETVTMLHRLKDQGHALFCLSNMHHASIEYLEQAHDFWSVFSGKVISCRIKLCKPEAAIYKYLLKTYRLDPSQSVFIDDVEINLSAAQEFGIRTIRFENAVQCAGQLSQWGYL